MFYDNQKGNKPHLVNKNYGIWWPTLLHNKRSLKSWIWLHWNSWNFLSKLTSIQIIEIWRIIYVFKYASTQIRKSASAQVASIWVFNYSNMQASMRVNMSDRLEYESVQVCNCVRMWICKNASIKVYKYASMQLCK